MSIVAADWTVTRSTKVIAYIGEDHTGGTTGITAGSFVVGTYYKIASVGTTDFTLIGASANTVGVRFVATGVGSGTGTADEIASYATVIDFHRWLQGLADDAVAVGDDQLDITNTDPSRRSTDNIITLINGYMIGATEAEHLYDGSVIQDGGDIIYDGIVNFGNSDVQIQIIQNGVVITDDWWNNRDEVYGDGGLNYDDNSGISHRFMIEVRDAGADTDNRRLIGISRTFGNTYSEFRINATARGNNVLALSDSTDLNNPTEEGVVSGWGGISNIKEGYSAIDVDNNGANEYYYSKWDRSTYTINQFYERMKWLIRAGSASTMYGLNGELFRGVTHAVALTDLDSGAWVEPEALSWGSGPTAGTGQLLAIDDTTSGLATILWMQLLSGVVPNGNTITGTTNSATATAGTVTDRVSTLSTPFIGASTGSAIIGAYGVGIEATDLTSADKVTDLYTNVITPPNYVQNTVGGLVSGEDRVLVAPWDGSTYDTNGDPAIQKTQLSLDTALTTDNITAVEITESIPTDTPSSGYIRVTDNSGYERRLHYGNWENGTPNQFYNIDTTDGNEDFAGVNASVGNDIYIGYLDQDASGALVTAGSFSIGVTYVIESTGTTDFTLIGADDSSPGTIFTATGAGSGTGTARIQICSASFTGVYAVGRQLVVIVRDGKVSPIKQFISAWSFTGSNQTITAIRTTDE